MTCKSELDHRELSIDKVAGRLKWSNETVRLWVTEARQIRAERAVQIEQEFGIPRHLLRPDLFDPPKKTTRKKAKAA